MDGHSRSEARGLDMHQPSNLTRYLVSTFFLTQFLTSLLWVRFAFSLLPGPRHIFICFQATVAEKHGRRVVLVLSLLGSAVTCFIFGTSTTLQQAIVIRLAQGVFAGAVGVARGSVAFVTDATNEGRAYAILGYVLLFFPWTHSSSLHLRFCWGLGGVAGAIIGGSCMLNTFLRAVFKC